MTAVDPVPVVRSGRSRRPEPLGVGVLYNPSLADWLPDNRAAYDYVEILPDMFWTDRGPGANPRYAELATWMDNLRAIAAAAPLVAHGVSLSLGSAASFDLGTVERIREWNERYGFAWHSDHLSFARVGSADGPDRNAALAVPFPYDEEMLDLVAERVVEVRRRVPLFFAVENNVYFVETPEQDMSEAGFLNRLHRRTGCGILLDLHNLYTNARNHGFSPYGFLDDLDLDAVVEIHVAGGNRLGVMWTDSHAGPVAEPVWDLLDATVPRTPNLCGITFEFNDSYFPLLGYDGVRDQLARARTAWERLRP